MILYIRAQTSLYLPSRVSLWALIVCTLALEGPSWQQSLEAGVMRVAVDWRFVGTGLDLLWFLRGERTGSAAPDVHLQLQQNLQRLLELHLAAETREDVKM